MYLSLVIVYYIIIVCDVQINKPTDIASENLFVAMNMYINVLLRPKLMSLFLVSIHFKLEHFNNYRS